MLTRRNGDVLGSALVPNVVASIASHVEVTSVGFSPSCVHVGLALDGVRESPDS